MYGYEQRNDKELTIEVNETVELLNDKDEGWWEVRHVQSRRQGYVPSNYIAKMGSLEANLWFFDKTSRNEAERLLKSPPNMSGAFLIRRAENPKAGHEFSMSIRKNEAVAHFKIVKTKEGRFRILEAEHFDELHFLVEHYQQLKRKDLNLDRPCLRLEKPATMGLGVDDWEIEKSSLVQQKILGSGNFGKVWMGLWNGQVKVAVKEMKPGAMTSEDFLREADVMKKLNHPKLIKLLAVSTREEPYLIITELMENGALDSYLKDHAAKRKWLREKYLIHMGTQVAQGMACLEKMKLVHRDLAARNVLVGLNNQCKVADFGLAQPVIDESEYEVQGNNQPIPVKWTAPEAFRGDFSTKSDVWSFGILLTEIITHGQPPYPGIRKGQLLDMIRNQNYRMTPQNTQSLANANCPEKLHDIMMKCWKLDPMDRPGFFAIQDDLDAFYDANYR